MRASIFAAFLVFAAVPAAGQADVGASSGMRDPDESSTRAEVREGPPPPHAPPAVVTKASSTVPGQADLSWDSLRERANALRVELRQPSAAKNAEHEAEREARSADDEKLLTEFEELILQKVQPALGPATTTAIEELQLAEDEKARALVAAERAETALLEHSYELVAELQDFRAEYTRTHTEFVSAAGRALSEAKASAVELEGALQHVGTLGEGSKAADIALPAAIADHSLTLDAVRSATTTSVPTASFRGYDGARKRVLNALEDLRGVRGVPPAETGHDVTKSLSEALAATDAAMQRLRDDTQRWRHLILDRLRENESLAHRLRLEAQGKSSLPKRAELHRLSDLGAANAKAAVRHVFWSIRLHVERRAFEARHLPDRLRDPLYVGKVAWAGTTGLLFLIAWVWLSRRAPRISATVRRAAMGWTSTTGNARVVDTALNLAETLSPRLLMLLAIDWLEGVLTPVMPEPELAVVARMASWTIGYALLADSGLRLILRATRRRLVLTRVHRDRAEKSLRSILRYLVLTGFAVESLRGLLGEGALLQMTRAAALSGLLPIGVVLLRRWQEDIVGAYLRYRPDSSLASIVEQARGRWYGIFVALAAFAVVTSHAAAVLGRDFVLGFDQSRRALAFLFRLRIERQAQKRGLQPNITQALPEMVVTAFRDEPTAESDRMVDRFPDIDDVISRLQCPHRGGAVVVHAPWGVGRTSWTLQFVSKLPTGTRVIHFDAKKRLNTEQQFCAAWQRPLNADHAPATPDDVAAALLEAEIGTVILDGVELYFLRAIGGDGALTALTAIIAKTRSRVLWLLTCASPAYRYLCRTTGFDQHFDHVTALQRWSEEEIRALIQRRQKASGITANFDDLLVHEGAGEKRSTQVVETEGGYIRLLWNFAEGNPRVAQLFWLRSLYPDPQGRLRVQLYSAPTADDLEWMSDQERFLLAALHLHGSLSVEALALTCRQALPRVRAHIDRGFARGLYVRSELLDDSYMISLEHWQAAQVVLRRKNLLH